MACAAPCSDWSRLVPCQVFAKQSPKHIQEIVTGISVLGPGPKETLSSEMMETPNVLGWKGPRSSSSSTPVKGRDIFHYTSAPGPIQPGLEHFQGWGSHSFYGQCVPAHNQQGDQWPISRLTKITSTVCTKLGGKT